MSESDFEENSFDFGAMSAAVSSMGKVKPAQDFVGAPADKDEAEKKARDSGWVEKKAYDYSLYQNGVPTIPEGDEGVADSDAPRANPWASQAAKYLWTDEYGEVGPRHPGLEAELYNKEFHAETGQRMSTYLEEEVKEEGPANFTPIQKVRHLAYDSHHLD